MAKSQRLIGIDTARGIAVIIMVLIHATNRFQLAMTAREGTETVYFGLYQFLQGRGAALFLVLAGVGLSLQVNRRQDFTVLRNELLRRGLFLLAFGLVHKFFYSGDILHVIGIMTLLSIPLLRVRTPVLLTVVAGLAVAVPLIFSQLDFYANWTLKEVLVESGFGDMEMNSTTITYMKDVFWTPLGFLRHTFLEGLYALIPNFGLLLVGIVLGRQDLTDASLLRRMFTWSALALIGTLVVEAITDLYWLEIAILPHTPMYIVSAVAWATMIISLCQLVAEKWGAALGKVGRLAFTVYISHVIILALLYLGVVALWPQAFLQYPFWVPLATTALYMALAQVFARWHFAKYVRGPLEHIMRMVVKGRKLAIRK